MSVIFCEEDVDTKFGKFGELIRELYEFVPIRRIRLLGEKDAWMKAEPVALALSYRDMAFRAYRLNPTRDRWSIFCRYRNRAKAVIRKEKRLYFTRLFSKLDSSGMWRLLRNAGCCVSDELEFDGNVDHINEFFATSPHLGATHGFDFDQFVDPVNGFSFQCVNELDIFRSLDKVRSRATGVDDIVVDFIKLIYPHVSDVVCHLTNTILTTSIFPATWKVARVVPIPKTKYVVGPSDLRPISILPALSKVIEHIIKDQIISSIGSRIADSQFAFRRGHSTTSLMVSLTDSVRFCANEGKECVLVSLDLTKAFNSLCFSTLLTILRDKFGFSRSACKLIMSYLSDRWQFVDLNGKQSGLLPLKAGVPQGSVLGPLLFLLYMNELPSIIDSEVCTPFLFADDIFLLFSADRDCRGVLESNINGCLGMVTSWLDRHSLSVNPSKSKAMFFTSGRTLSPVLSISIRDIPIEFVVRQKCLGIIIDSNLGFEAHLNCIYGKISNTLRRIYSLSVCLPVNVKKRLAFSLMMPHVLYGLEVISGAGVTNLGILGRAVNSIVRFVFNVRRRDHISDHVRSFLGCSFDQYVRDRNLIFFYNVMKRGLPRLVFSEFAFSRSNRNKQLVIPRIRCLLFERSFMIRVARSWNGLPLELRIFSHSNNVFRLKLRSVAI